MTEIKSACPDHQIDTGGSDSYVFNESKGQGFCHSCSLVTWLDDKGRLWGRKTKGSKPYLIEGEGHLKAPSSKQEDAFSNTFNEEYDVLDNTEQQGTYKPMRGITKDTMEFFGVVTYGDSQEYVYPTGGIKVRKLPKDFHAKNGFKGDELFGMNLFPAGCSKVVVCTEGELDALSAWQMLKNGSFVNPVVSFPSASPSGKLWEKCKKYLDSFDKIVLSVDNDEAGQKLQAKVSEIFPDKTFIMNHGDFKDANDFLQAGMAKEYKSAWWNAKKFKPDSILSDADDYLKLYEDSPDFEYFTTGIEQLDEKMLGISKGYVTLVQAETGLGKCLGGDVEVLMYDGTTKKSKNVVVGDILMGDDGGPRNVLSTTSGVDDMYEIQPVKGDSWICNSVHTLSLYHNTDHEVVDIDLDKYLMMGNHFKHRAKQFRVGVDSFGVQGTLDYPFMAPYAYGVFLGDGSKHRAEAYFGLKKKDVMDKFIEQVEASGFITTSKWQPQGNCFSVLIRTKDRKHGTNPFIKFDTSLVEFYKRDSVWVRKQFLAGILDTDGYLTGGCFDLVQKDERVIDAVVFAARSLGLAAYKKKVKKGVKSIGFEGTYYRCSISGDIDMLPTLRHKLKPRKQIKSVLRTGFSVKKLGKGTYYGFEIDGNKRFLLGDFTVTHNTEFCRYLENRALNYSDYKIAAMHLEESKLRSLLGLVSYKLGENVTIKKFIDEKGLDEEVRGAITEISESERFVTFDFDMQEGHEELIKQVRYLVAAMSVDFIFIEPIQDCVTGSSSEKEGKLADLITQLSTLASKLNVGIVVVAHQNADGGSMYSSMITKRAAFELLLKRDRDSDDVVEKNRTHVVIGRKNRCGLGNGPAGALDFDLESYTLKPVEPMKAPVVNREDF